MNLNEVKFAGNAGRDAEDKIVGNGTRIVTFSLGHTQKGKNGAADKTTWLTCKAFGFSADTAARIKKGMNVFVAGPLNIDDYTDKNGVKKTSTCVIAHSIGIIERESYRQTDHVKTPAVDAYNPFGEDIPF